ncbi:MAG: YggS family pyridoxal phosphate-dependent enzyme [Cocleimonas sp.]|nr:YggS family pyridoxal phosphate-dependent enzyme [Cocleimonas sp.]
MTQIRDKLQIIGVEIKKNAQQYQRDLDDVALLAVSKLHSAEAIQAAYDAGQRAFGENYVQELVEKAQELSALNISWHFIGPLQSNKTKHIAEVASWVHTVDRFKIAQRLNDQRPEGLPPLSVCIQINISGEASKSGVSPNELEELASKITKLPRLRLRGLMVIPALSDSFESQRATFAEVSKIKDTLNQQSYTLDTLSMGMSGDMEAAIAEGATIVRIGTAIFGTRDA